MIELIILFYVLVIATIVSIVVAYKKIDFYSINNTFYFGLHVALYAFVIIGGLFHVLITNNVQEDRQRNKELSINADAKLKNAKENDYEFFFCPDNITSKKIKNVDAINTSDYIIEYNELLLTAKVYKKFNEAEYNRSIRIPRAIIFEVLFIVCLIMFIVISIKEYKKVCKFNEDDGGWNDVDVP